jgi:lipid-A-disaccharide synthase
LAGEPSGDLHAARLMEQLLHYDSSIEFIGIGGDNMAKFGLKSLVPIEQMSVVGLNEVLKNILFFKKVMNICRTAFENEQFDAFIPVDYPGFNLRLAKFAKKKEIPVLYYIAPQLWAWGKNRTQAIKDRVDLLMVVFPFEVEFFGKLGINTTFVGHPLLDDPTFGEGFLPHKERNRVITVMPGSRKQEIIKHNDLVGKIIRNLKDKLPDYDISIAISKVGYSKYYDEIEKQYPFVDISTEPKKLMKHSAAGIIKTGTSNLEAALSGLPINMFYKTSSLSYWLGKRLVNLEYLSLINILSDKKIINEYIQQEAKAELIVNDIADIVNNEERYSEIQRTYTKIRKMLGESGASQRAAVEILDFVQ